MSECLALLTTVIVFIVPDLPICQFCGWPVFSVWSTSQRSNSVKKGLMASVGKGCSQFILFSDYNKIIYNSGNIRNHSRLKKTKGTFHVSDKTVYCRLRQV